jgi:hypothetical protein
MSLGTILLIILVLILVGVIPTTAENGVLRLPEPSG